MKFHKLTDTCKPEACKEVLVRIDSDYNYRTNKRIPIKPHYYVVIREPSTKRIPIYDKDIKVIKYEDHDFYTEAGGEMYNYCLDYNISHWCYTSDIESEVEEI